MQEVKLSDQLGAMAIIDELYQKQQLLLEHLDRDKLRSSLTEKIKNYYQTKGLTIDDKTINDGVDLWFDSRLRFSTPKRSWLQRVLIFCYIKRNFLFLIVGFLLFVFFVVGSISLVNSLQLKKNIGVAYSHILASKQSLANLSKELESLSKQDITYAQVPVKKLRTSIADLLNQEKVSRITRPVINDTLTTTEIKQTFETLKKYDFSIKDKLSLITSQMSQLRTLTENDHKLAQLINNQKFTQASKRYPVLQIAVDSVIDSLNSGGTSIDTSQIEKLYDSVDRATTLENKMTADITQLKSLDVPDTDLEPVTALQTALIADLKSLKFGNVDNYNKMIAYYIKLAQTALTLTIVDEPDSKSGVERTHNNTSGKSWFLIVRPMTPSGHAQSLWVKSIETGKTELVDMFGQQVSQNAFDLVRKDKAQDGHIDNSKLCDKPIGRLGFECPSSVKAGRILEW
ncbi:DUF6384 family protein [Orbus wheelerorum]|uniref:DUF6384 family protein n=1 Tax=Orbus wheelerorum TaxID=3074111 RepID=UPI00370D6CED